MCVQNVVAITFMCLDMNNLHSWRLSAYLPYGGFEWLKNVVAINFMYLIIKVFTCCVLHFIVYKMAVSSKIKSHSDIVDHFKELPFYNNPIEKPKIGHLKNIDQLAELPFFEQLSIIKTNQAFRGYAMS